MLALGGAAGVLLLHESRAQPARGATAVGAGLPASPEPALPVPRPIALARERHVSYWSPVDRALEARAGPSADAAVVARLATQTPEGTANLVLVLGRATDEAGRVWLHVRLPVLPNNSTGWVPRRGLGGYELVRTHLVVELRRLTATLFRNGRAVFRAPVGVGKRGWPTPRGRFYIRNRLSSYSSPFYGPLAFGTSARSAVLTDWPAGGFIGIHGTNRPDRVPGRVSHGCIRMRNRDIVALARLMPVGTPLTVR